MLDLYKNIKKARQDLNLTQSELANRTGYADKSMIAKIESGKVDLPQSKIELFASALNTTPRHLMGWDTKLQSSQVTRTLSPDEVGLLDDYQLLNDAGKDKAREYISDLAGNDKYTQKGTGSEGSVSA